MRTLLFFKTLCLCAFVPLCLHIYGTPAAIGTMAMDFVKLDVSAKSESIGTALTAGKEITAMSLNPAGISGIAFYEIKIRHLWHLENISFLNIDTVFPSAYGNFGINIGLLDLGSQTRTTLADRDGSINHERFSNSGYLLGLVYANSFNEVNWGVTIKYASQTLDAWESNAIGLDLGAQYQVIAPLNLGISVSNITLKKTKYMSITAALPQTIRMGLLYDTHSDVLPIQISADYVIPSDDKAHIGLGLQYQLNTYLHVRGGYTNYNTISNYAVGLGLCIENMVVDFAYKPASEFGQSFKAEFGLRF